MDPCCEQQKSGLTLEITSETTYSAKESIKFDRLFSIMLTPDF
jgi:hypothetical protein